MPGEGVRAGLGVLSYDTAHLLGGAMLVLSFALLQQRRITALIDIFAAQGLALALAALWQGWVQGAPDLYVTGVIAFAAKAVAIPAGMRAVARRLDTGRPVESALGVFPTMALGVGLVLLAILVVPPAAPRAATMTREDLALALSVVLLGLLLLMTRRDAAVQVIGLMSLENGLILAAAGVGLPFLAELSIAFLVMIAFILYGLFFFRGGERSGSRGPHRVDGPLR